MDRNLKHWLWSILIHATPVNAPPGARKGATTMKFVLPLPAMKVDAFRYQMAID